MIRVLLVDDHKLVRTGMRHILERADDIEVMGEAESGEAAVDMVRELAPDVVLMDVNMPGIGGLEATRKLLSIKPELRIVVVSVHVREPYPGQLMAAGALGYLTKDCDEKEILAAVRQVMMGKRYITAAVAHEMALRQLDGDHGSPFESLSQREMQVMMMVSQGYSVQEISDRLCLSPKTVSTYRSRLFQKLDVSNDVELIHLAIRHGILSQEEDEHKISR